MEHPIKTDDDWGYPYFRKPPSGPTNSMIFRSLCLKPSILGDWKFWTMPVLARIWLWSKKPTRSAFDVTLPWQKKMVWLHWGFPEIGVPPVIIHFNGILHYKPSILGYPHFWKPPCKVLESTVSMFSLGQHSLQSDCEARAQKTLLQSHYYQANAYSSCPNNSCSSVLPVHWLGFPG